MTTRQSKKAGIGKQVTDVSAHDAGTQQESEGLQAAPAEETAQFAEQQPTECESHGSAAEAIRKGAERAKVAAGEFFPGVGRLARKSFYGTFYYASFGVVFTALSVARLIPTDNIMGEGLRDGAIAARKAVEHVEDVAETAQQPDAVPA